MTTAGLPDILLDVPPDFHEVPLEPAIEDRVAAQAELLDQIGLEDGQQREGLALYLEAVARSLADGPVVGTAFCAVELDGRPSTATLTVAPHDVATDDPLVAISGIAEALRRDGGYRAVAVEPAAGRSVVVARGRVPAGALDLHQVTVAVPLPGYRFAVLVTIATPATDDVDTYERVVRKVAESVRVATD